jgi:hypothetical protein
MNDKLYTIKWKLRKYHTVRWPVSKSNRKIVKTGKIALTHIYKTHFSGFLQAFQ